MEWPWHVGLLFGSTVIGGTCQYQVKHLVRAECCVPGTCRSKVIFWQLQLVAHIYFIHTHMYPVHHLFGTKILQTTKSQKGSTKCHRVTFFTFTLSLLSSSTLTSLMALSRTVTFHSLLAIFARLFFGTIKPKRRFTAVLVSRRHTCFHVVPSAVPPSQSISVLQHQLFNVVRCVPLDFNMSKAIG